MSNRNEFYIGTSLEAIEKLARVLAPHGIQVVNILEAKYSSVGNYSSAVQGIPPGVHPKLTVELYVSLDHEEPLPENVQPSEALDCG